MTLYHSVVVLHDLFRFFLGVANIIASETLDGACTNDPGASGIDLRMCLLIMGILTALLPILSLFGPSLLQVMCQSIGLVFYIIFLVILFGSDATACRDDDVEAELSTYALRMFFVDISVASIFLCATIVSVYRNMNDTDEEQPILNRKPRFLFTWYRDY
jgi:hypothetical protein